MTAHRIAVIAGDGIGPEVTSEALKVLAASGVEHTATHFELGAAHYLKTGEVLSEATLGDLRGFDAIFLGAIGAPVDSRDVPPGILERGLILRLRFELDLYINLRPFSGTPDAIAHDADFVVVRENTEGPYVGEGGFLRRGTAAEVATQGSVNTRFGVERCLRYAFQVAEARPRRSLTLIHKTNVLTFSGDLWRRAFEEVARDHPAVETQYNHVDAATIYLATDARRYDVIVTDNLFGDVLTDLAAAVTGGIGLAGSANLNPARTGPSLFEPVHGAAHDIAGSGRANPLAAIRSVAMMLDHLGEEEAAARVMKAAAAAQSELAGRPPKTSEIGAAVVEHL